MFESCGEFLAAVFNDVPNSLVTYAGYVFKGGLWSCRDDQRGMF